MPPRQGALDARLLLEQPIERRVNLALRHRAERQTSPRLLLAVSPLIARAKPNFVRDAVSRPRYERRMPKQVRNPCSGCGRLASTAPIRPSVLDRSCRPSGGTDPASTRRNTGGN